MVGFNRPTTLSMRKEHWPLNMCNIALMSQTSGKQQNDHDDYDQTQAATGVVTPRTAIGPGRQRTEQQKDQQYDKNRVHNSSILVSKSTLIAIPELDSAGTAIPLNSYFEAEAFPSASA
jgi:hypothetical protein